jgi:D-galactarolactone isomerase
MHFYGDPERYPVAPTNALPVPRAATVEDYQIVMQRLGIDRAVVVQPSAYATDNRCTLDGMRALGGQTRGVAVVDPAVTDDEMYILDQAGIRGQRFHMFPGGVLDWNLLEPMAARVHDFGWHIQLQLDGRQLAEREASLMRLPGNLVIDHIGKFMEPVGTDHPGFRALLRLLERGRCWVKLSAPYTSSHSGPPHYEDIGELVRTLIEAAPQRMLWASNWPHPSLATDARPDDARWLNVLLDWCADDAIRRRILVDNPAELYGF